MTVVKIGVLALQGDVREHIHVLSAIGSEATVVTKSTHLTGLQGLVLPGGESTTMGRLMVEYGLDQAITSAARAGLSILGTCAGLILLADDILGSEQPRLGLLPVTIRRNAYGRQVDSFETKIDIPVLGPPPASAVFIRAPRLEQISAGVDVLAEHGGHPVLVQKGKILGCSFHPELTSDTRIHQYFVSLAASVTASV